MGGCISCGMGQLDPATLLAINDAFVHAKDLWKDILQIFGIGAGAREADAIVPLQNQIVSTVIAPVSDFLTSVNNGAVTPTCEELKTWQTQVNTAKAKWLDFLHNTQWQDGRAATQAEATLAPYWTNIDTDLTKYITQYCKTLGGILTTPAGDVNWPVIGIGAAALFFLTRK